MSPLLKKEGKLIKQGGKLVEATDPATCSCCGGGDGGECPPGKFCSWTPPDPCSTGKCTSFASDTPIECPEGFPYDCTSEQACNDWYAEHPNEPCACWVCVDGVWVNKPAYALDCSEQGGYTGSSPPEGVECQPKECEFPYNVTVSTSLTNVRLDPELEAAAGSKAGDIKKRLEEILVLNPPTFTRWCCTVDNCSLTDSIDGGYSDFDGVAQEASTIVSGSGANLDAGISVYTQNYFFNGSHLVSGLQYTPNGTTGLHRVDIYEFYFGPFGNPPESMTLRKICDGKTKYTFSENRYMGQVSIDYTPENGESNRAIGGYYGDATYTVEWDYGGPPNQRKKLIEQENPLP